MSALKFSRGTPPSAKSRLTALWDQAPSKNARDLLRRLAGGDDSTLDLDTDVWRKIPKRPTDGPAIIIDAAYRAYVIAMSYRERKPRMDGTTIEGLKRFPLTPQLESVALHLRWVQDNMPALRERWPSDAPVAFDRMCDLLAWAEVIAERQDFAERDDYARLLANLSLPPGPLSKTKVRSHVFCPLMSRCFEYLYAQPYHDMVAAIEAAVFGLRTYDPKEPDPCPPGERRRSADAVRKARQTN